MTKLPFVASILLLCAAVELSQGASIVKQPKTVCYYNYWDHYRGNDRSMYVEHIDSNLCSHIVYAYFGIDYNIHELSFLDTALEQGHHDLKKFVSAKGRAKAMIAIQGYWEIFQIVDDNEQYLEKFVDSVVKFLLEYKFDGVVIEWYGIPPDTRVNYSKLFKRIHIKFASNEFSLGITINQPEANRESISKINFVDFIETVDFVNVHTFDYVNPSGRHAGDSTPLDKQLATLTALAKQGIPREKLLMGVPFTARVWKLKNGSDDTATDSSSLLSYNELCTMMKSSPSSFSIHRTGNQSVNAFVVQNDQTREFISYEDPQLLAYKASNITAEGYGGMTVFALSDDDFCGRCGEPYILLRAIAQGFKRDSREQETFTLKTTTLAPHDYNRYCAIYKDNSSRPLVKQPKTVCYYESWIHYRTGAGSMEVGDIDSSLCSHIVYAYFGIDSTSHELKFIDPYLEKDLHDLDKFVQAKGRAKAMIAIGGAVNSDQFAIVAANEQYLESFVDSVVKFLVQYQFDGVVIDWYHFGSSNENDFEKLLKKFAQKFVKNQFTLGMTIAEPNKNWESISSLYFVDFIDTIDFVNVLTFDYVNQPDRFAGDSSPLDDQLGTLSALAKRGIPREKLLMGVPFYARVWKLEKGSYDKATGPGAPGPNTKNPGVLSYNELCTMIKSSPGSFTIERYKNQSVRAIMVQSDQTREFISYEDPKLLAYKASNITAEGYGGMTVYMLASKSERSAFSENAAAKSDVRYENNLSELCRGSS